MKLRNAHLAIVDGSKVLDYLLNEAYPDNGGKARFFGLLGYSREVSQRVLRASRHSATFVQLLPFLFRRPLEVQTCPESRQ